MDEVEKQLVVVRQEFWDEKLRCRMLQEILYGLKADEKMHIGRHKQATHNNDKVQDALEPWQVLRLDTEVSTLQPSGIPKEREEKAPKPHGSGSVDL